MKKDKNILYCVAFLIMAAILVFATKCSAKTIKVAIIDSGITDTSGIKLCAPPVNFTAKESLDAEYHGHGDNITHIITDGLEKQNYCVYILKAFSEENTNNLVSSTFAMGYAIDKNVDIINVSSGGKSNWIIEEAVVKLALNRGIKIVAAAGNENQNLDKVCDYFPACIPGVFAIGNLQQNGEREKHSNYGNYIKIWKKGTLITAGGVTMTGTSQATALATRDILIKMLKENK